MHTLHEMFFKIHDLHEMFFKIHDWTDCEVLLTSVYEARYKLRSARNGRRKNFGQEKLVFLTTKNDPLRSKELRLVKKNIEN